VTLSDAGLPVEAGALLPAPADPVAPAYAGIGPRAAAWIVDFIIALVIGSVATAPVPESGRWVDAIGFAILLVAWYVYLVVSEAVWGVTPGQRLLRVRAMGGGGARCTRAAVMKRNLSKAAVTPQAGMAVAAALAPRASEDGALALGLLAFVVLAIGAGLLMRRDRARRSVGDRLAGSFVVRRSAVVGPAGAAGLAWVGADEADVRRSRRRDRKAPRLGPAPWRLRDVALVLAIAVGPFIVLNLVRASGPALGASAGLALVALVTILVEDGWLLAWAWRFSLRRYHLGLAAWGFRRPPLSILWLVPLAFVINAVVEVVYGSLAPVQPQKISDVFPHTLAGALLFVAVTCVMAPVLEEVFCRAFLFRGLIGTFGPLWAAVISAAIFAAMHLQPSGFLPLFVGGLLLAWLYYRTSSLWTNIALHAVINAVATLIWILQ
jgi:uncharacterized protein